MTESAGTLILVIGRDPTIGKGGGESYVRAHALAARDLGLHPHIFTLAPITEAPRGDVRETEIGTLHRVPTPLMRAPLSTLPLHEPLLRSAIVRFLRDRPGRHVLHSFSFWTGLSAETRRRLGAVGVDVDLVTTAWCTVDHETLAKRNSAFVRASPIRRARAEWALRWNRLATLRVERRAVLQSRHILVNYESVARQLTDAYGPGLPIRYLTYTPPTSFDDLRDTETPPELRPARERGTPVILSMSRHDGRKGIDVLLRALALLRDRGVDFAACICGGGVLWEAHRALARDLGLDDLVIFSGRVPDTMTYLRAADVFVLPSLEESSGSVAVLEALQAGVAVVSTDVDGMPEDITDGVDGLLVPPADPHALAVALQQLITDVTLRRRLAVAGLDLYERRFSRAAAVADLGRLYRELGLLPPGDAPESP